MNPDVSVIIPNFNGDRFLRQAIDSALNQEEIHTEVIVVDDGSTDDSRNLLESYGEQIQVFYQENNGAPAARNLGWKNANTSFIKFLDSDDILLPNALVSQIQKLKNLTNSQVPFGDIQFINESNNVIDGSYKLRGRHHGQTVLEHLLQYNPLTSSPLHTKDQLEAIGGFDETLIKGQEWDLHLRLVLAGFEFVYFPEFVYQFRISTGGNSHSSMALTKKGPNYFYKVFDHQLNLIMDKFPELTPIEKRLIGRRFWAYGRGILREGYKLESSQYFNKALELAGKDSLEGSKLYKFLTHLTNPILAEKALMLLK